MKLVFRPNNRFGSENENGLEKNEFYLYFCRPISFLRQNRAFYLFFIFQWSNACYFFEISVKAS